jgi:hypothetical protein
MNVIGIDCEHTRDEHMAQEALRTLVNHYPGHGWFVVIRGGVMHVKDMEINPNWGMCLHYSQIKGDAADRAREIVRAAGEFLERANLKRGASEGVHVKHVEGIPDKHIERGQRL